nr:DEAD/DEAH box helicase [Corynebacterium atypicum]
MPEHPEFSPLSGLGLELVSAIQRRLAGSTATFSGTLPARPAVFANWPEWVDPAVRAAVEHRGVEKLFSHQALTATLAHQGRNVVVATGTSSGKSLAYLLPVLSRLRAAEHACALYLTPTRALGSDQLAATSRLIAEVDGLANVHPAPYDGDTPVEARAGIRQRSRMVFSTPDMLHSSLLAHHPRWARLLRHLDFVIIDECHTYRGVFGANVALVLRRLQRIAAHYGSNPTFILASATSADPQGQAERLLGQPVDAVTDDGAPTGRRAVLLWEPGFLDDVAGEHGAPVRRAATTEAADVMATLVAQGARTLSFVRSRRAAEIVSLRCQETLSALGRPDFARRISAYRAGYLAEDRRRLERALDEGDLLGVATTNALELGIDVGALDATVTAGFPGTIASLRQQAGRAGRRGQESLMVFIARDEPLDTFLVHHPEVLLGHPLERSVFDPYNPYVLYNHVYLAAVEKPLSEQEVEQLHAREVVEQLARDGLLRRRELGWFPTPRTADAQGLRPDTAHAQLSLRGEAGGAVMIVDATDGRLLGTVEQSRAAGQVFPSAVYLHQGESFVVDQLDWQELLALAHPEAPEYSTHPRSQTDIRIVSAPGADEVFNPAPGIWVAAVDVEVTDQVTGYVVRLPDGQVVDQIALDMPPTRLTTRCVAFTIDPVALQAMGVAAGEIPGSLHAAEHAAIGLLPLIATCDRWDLGGVSTAEHPDTGLPTVFVYDGHPGGAGFSDCGFEHFGQWMSATFEAVRNCSCQSGCPSCVQSPKCGNGNEPLDKAGALRVLGALAAACG